MYTIPIDDLRYHANILSEKEKRFGNKVYMNACKRYPKLKEIVSKTVKPLGLSKEGENILLGEITLAFCRVLKEKEINTEEELLAKVKRWISSFLPYIVNNLLHSRASNPVQYEPVAMATFYAVDTLLAEFHKMFSAAENGTEFERYFSCELCNWFRVVRSSLLLLNYGDDAHGIALFRGSMEQLAKLVHMQNFSEEYLLFKNFNVCLQAKKFNDEPLPAEMVDFLQNDPDHKKNRNTEVFLGYGWARNKKGDRILKMSDFVKEAFPQNALEKSLYVLSSEFVHEDYAGVGYDYISIRKGLIDYYYLLAHMLEQLLSYIGEEKRYKQIAHLFRLTDPIYTGEHPLSVLDGEE